MPIQYQPKRGQILLCDFSKGFKEPEMVKDGRPVVVLSAKGNLVTVVACSTVEPVPVANYHYLIPKKSTPKIAKFMNKDTWVKGDMVYTVGFHRLELVCVGNKNGKREYFRDRLGNEQMNIITKCVLNGIGMGFLTSYVGLSPITKT